MFAIRATFLWWWVVAMLGMTGGSCRRAVEAFTLLRQSMPTIARRAHHHSSTCGLLFGMKQFPSVFYAPIISRPGLFGLAPSIPHTTTRLFSSINDGKTSASSSSNSGDSWTVPKSIDIPEERVELNFVRSSGAGGQNVNKVNSQVQLRLHVASAHWIPTEVRERLQEQQASRISKDGYLVLHMQEHRTQMANRKAAFHKLHEMLLLAWPRPKVRTIREGISQGEKVRRKEDKRRRGEVKAGRRPVEF